MYSNNLVFRKLRELGMTEQEAKICIFLAKNGSTTAKNLSVLLNINKVQVYRNLKNMQNRNLVVSESGCPAKFSVKAFQEIIDIVCESKIAEAKLLQCNKQEVLSEFAKIEKPSIELKEKFSIIENSSSLYCLTKDALFSAKKELKIMVSELAKFMPDIDLITAIFEANEQRGVINKTLLLDNCNNRVYTKKIARKIGEPLFSYVQFSNFNNQEHFQGFLIRDNEEVIFMIAKDEWGNPHRGIVTNNPSMVSYFNLLFDSSWTNIEKKLDNLTIDKEEDMTKLDFQKALNLALSCQANYEEKT
jgi:sugar-specific transcriptional regulator TrmB